MHPHARKLVALSCFAIALAYAPARVRTENSAPHPVTVTPENATSLNPTLSGDGRRIVFESTADLTNTGGTSRFRCFSADTNADPFTLARIADSRAPAAAVSEDGSPVAFASAEDLTGENADRNSEIFLSDASGLHQLTHTTPADASVRAADGNFQPSISDDGSLVAFSSNRDLAGANSDGNLEIFLYDLAAQTFTQVTNTREAIGASDAKLSGEGSRIAFIRDNTPIGSPAQSNRDLVIFDRASKSFQTLASDAASLSLTPGRAISDDGTRVVFSAETSANASQLFLYDGRNGVTRQITRLSSRASDVELNATISGDGSRVAFATRRSVVGGNSDSSVELYLYDM